MNFIEDLKKAKDLQNQRLFEEAKNIYKKIIMKDKENFNANIGLAIIYFSTNKISNSIDLLKNLIEIYPNKIESYLNLSNILISQNKHKEAINILLKAHKVENKNLKIIENLCFLYLQLKKYYDVKKFAELGIRLDNKNYFIYNILGQVFFIENIIEKSILNFNLSIESNNKFWPPYDNLLVLYEQINNLEDFNKILIKAMKIFVKSSNLCRLKFFQALLFFRNNKYQDSLNLLKEIENQIQNHNIKNQQSYYDLMGKNFDKLKKFDLAFMNFTKRNEKIIDLEENKKFNKETLINLINNYEKYFVQENIKKFHLLDKTDNYSDPVFLVGFPRSGTTLLDTILRTHSKTFVLEEKPYISLIRDEFFKSNNNLISALENIKFNELKKIRQNYFANIKKISNNNSSEIIIDKLPLNIIEIGFIKRIFPNSKFILMLRHPCDSVLSCFVTDFNINEAMVHFLNIDDAAKLYSRVFNLWNQFTKVLKIQFHIIKYEKVITHFDETINNLLNFLEINWEDNLRNFNKTAIERNRIKTPSYNQVINPLNTSSIGRWKNYDKMKNIENKLGEWIEFFKY